VGIYLVTTQQTKIGYVKVSQELNGNLN
jgi:hypothetical protein